ncbi:hypothetical protein ABZV60_05520 [Streptomyces sp. NPDC004787]|uniref:hypothetical protein n=1 Tax=Streptomyces sp. NPDC004787 TaxID=3154291 RepID=UPI0033B4350A
MSRRRGWARAAALLLLPVLAACGIQGSDVVEAGGPAPVTVHPTASPRVMLFFAGPDGRLMMTVRQVGFVADREAGRIVVPTFPADGSDRVATDKVLSALLEGPDDKERAAGLTTRLALHGRAAPHVEVSAGDGPRELLLRLSVRVRDLDPVAVRQLVCTTAYAEEYGSAVPVVVSGTDGALPPAVCPLV